MYNNDLKEYYKQPLIVNSGNLISTMNDTLQFEDKNATNGINDNFNTDEIYTVNLHCNAYPSIDCKEDKNEEFVS